MEEPSNQLRNLLCGFSLVSVLPACPEDGHCKKWGGKLILQSCIVPDEVCSTPEIYYRSSNELRVDQGGVLLKAGETISSNTYMNLFDVGTWRRYTTVETIRFSCQVEGKGTIALIHQEKNVRKKIKEVSYDFAKVSNRMQQNGLTVAIELPTNIRGGMIYFMLKADSETRFCHAEFSTDALPDRRISLSLVICTYKRKAYLEKNIEKLKDSPVLQALRDTNRFVVRIVDNARELSDSYGRSFIVYPNENTGGSGGFSRGMEESTREKEKYQTSHVVLMDDDVELQTESMLRLYALLSYMKSEYGNEAVAGRMFRLDRREIQYTAAEIWNGGDLRHIGWNQDMTLEENLSAMNENEGAEYGGWWFACYPMEFVVKNRPLPFFLHCDDVEYGLRHGGTPIILNGIQVWHETYEYRQSPVMAYYDTRNTLIVNQITGGLSRKEIIIEKWKEEIAKYHVRKDYINEWMIIKGMWDFLTKDIRRIDPAKKHTRLLANQNIRPVMNAIFWRMTFVLAEIRIAYEGKGHKK